MGKFIEVGVGASARGGAVAAARQSASEAVGQLHNFAPSLTVVFASGTLDPDEVSRGVADVVGDCPTVGTSSAGEIFQAGLTKGSVSVTVLASPYLSAEVGVGQGVGRDWRAAIEAALPSGSGAAYFRDGPKLGRPYYLSHPLSGLSPLFVMMFSPGDDLDNPTRSHEIHRFLTRRTLGRVPIAGGGSGTPDLSLGTFQLANGRAYRDSVVLATVETDLLFGLGVAHGFRPTRKRAVVTRAEGHVVYELDDRPAAEVCAELMAVELRELDREPMGFSRKPFGAADAYGHHRLLTPQRVLDGGAIQFAPTMDAVEAITLMEVDHERQAASAQEAVARAMEIGHVRDPSAVVLFDCITRYTIDAQAPAIEEEGLRRIRDLAPVTGFLTFGEYGITEEGLPIYCNQSLVALVLGNELELSAVATRRRVNALKEIETELERRTRELAAIRRANEIPLDENSWRDNLREFERLLKELTGAESVEIRVDFPEQVPVDHSLEPAGLTGDVVELPLVSLGRHLGRVLIRRERGLQSEEVAASICQLVARGLYSVFRERTIEEQAREIDTVHNMAREILTAADYRVALGNISRQIAGHVGATGFSLWVGDEQTALSCLTGDVADELAADLAAQAVQSRTTRRAATGEAHYLASPLLVKHRINGALVLSFDRGAGAAPLRLAFLSYLSVPLAVTVEIYARHRESNLAREIHHRVKNNLQIIASLLHLQLRRVEDPFAREPLENSIRRIMSIAVVHEALCEKHVSRVDAVGLLRSIADLVVEGIGAPNQRLTVSVEGIPDLTLSSQQATSLAIMVNELVGNALKHGLQGAPQGEIKVRLEREAGQFLLTVSDDGSGLPPWFELGKSRGLGLQLIMRMARSEFSGSFSLGPRQGRGVEAQLVFPEEAIGPAGG